MVAGLGLLLLACPPPPSPPPGEQPVPPSGPHALWTADVQSLENPFPDDRLLDANGFIQMRAAFHSPFIPDYAETLEADALADGYMPQLAKQKGWGTFASLLVLFSQLPDAASITPERFRVISLDNDASEVTIRPILRADPGYVEVEPQHPMRPATHYALVVTRGLTAAAKPVVQSPDFWAWSRSEGSGAVATAASRLGISAEDILLLVKVTTQEPTVGMTHAARLLDDVEPAFTIPPDMLSPKPMGVFEPADYPSVFPGLQVRLSATRRVVLGQFESLDFRDANGVFDDATAVAGTMPTRMERLEFLLAQPDPALFPPPWKTVLAQHGFSSSNRFIVGIAEELNAAGFAVIGIDAVSHGGRGNILTFFDVANLPRVRDNFRQTVLDQLQLARLVKTANIDVDGVPGPDLDGTVLYFGHSMGAIVGAVHCAISGDGRVAVLNAPGGGLTRIMDSPGLRGGIGLLVRPLLGMELSSPGYEESLPFLRSVAQAIFDPADPINYGVTSSVEPVGPTPRILVQMDVDDGLVPNPLTDALALAQDISVRQTPSTNAAGLRAVTPIDTSLFAFPEGEDPHSAYFHIAPARTQAARFFTSGGTELIGLQ